MCFLSVLLFLFVPRSSTIFWSREIMTITTVRLFSTDDRKKETTAMTARRLRDLVAVMALVMFGFCVSVEFGFFVFIELYCSCFCYYVILSMLLIVL